MKLAKEAAFIEAILFLDSEPLDSKTIAKISGFSNDVVIRVIDNLKEKYSGDDHGIELVEIGGGYLLSPKTEFWEYLKDRYGKRNENRLSRAALETLSIIAYSQPITKGEMENIRGVSADGMIKLLLSRNLIKTVGKKETPGKPVQYGTTKEFLKVFRLKSIADLPKLTELDEDRFELNG